MTLQITKEDYEKSYLDSMYVISHSKNTTKSYKTRIRLLRKFLSEAYQIDEYDLLDHYNKKTLDILKIFKDFVIYLDKAGKSPRTIHLALSVNKGYLRHMGIKIDSDDLKQVVKVPKVVRIREMPLDKEIILRLLHNAKPKLQLAILMAVSTGMRIGEIVQLKISDVDFEEILDNHKQIQNGVLLSSSLWQGIDLKDDLSRFQIIEKCPYLYLGDKRVMIKKEKDANWYRYQTIMKLLQGFGRSVRNEKDYAITYVLDGAVQRLLKYYKFMVPQAYHDVIYN